MDCTTIAYVSVIEPRPKPFRPNVHAWSRMFTIFEPPRGWICALLVVGRVQGKRSTDRARRAQASPRPYELIGHQEGKDHVRFMWAGHVVRFLTERSRLGGGSFDSGPVLIWRDAHARIPAVDKQRR